MLWARWLPDGKMSYETWKLLIDFYFKLYSSANPTVKGIVDFVQTIFLPILKNEHKEFLDAPITVFESEKAIGDQNANKTPGPNRFTSVFYKYIRVC